MDIPVSVMILAGCVSILIAADDVEQKSAEAWDALVLATLFTGLAVITKQPGIVLLIPFGMLLGYAWWTKGITRSGLGAALLIALLPLGGVLAMYLTKYANPVGNLERLQAITIAAAKSDHPIRLAADHLLDAMPMWAFALVTACALMNLLDVRRFASWIGLTLSILSIVGFFQYATCCAYDQRNVWWTIALALGAGLFGLRNIDGFTVSRGASRWPAAVVRAGALLIALLAGLAVSTRVSDATIAEVQTDEQFGMLGAAGPMLKTKFLPSQRKEDVLITEMNVVKWTPGIAARVQLCGRTDHQCVVNSAKSAPDARTFVFIVRGWLEYPSIAHLLVEKRLLGKAAPFELYGPFASSEFSDTRGRVSGP